MIRQPKENQSVLFETAYEKGLSGTSGLHDRFISIERMSPAESENGGRNLLINYSFSESPFGSIILASTQKGICYLAFIDDEGSAFSEMQSRFPDASFNRESDAMHANALSVFQSDQAGPNQIKLHLKASVFQMKVWEALLKIPMGQLSTYGKIAGKIGKSKAARAVGTAIGSNPVAFLIPCHRVIQSSGLLGGYMWGPQRKKAIIGWEMTRTEDPIPAK